MKIEKYGDYFALDSTQTEFQAILAYYEAIDALSPFVYRYGIATKREGFSMDQASELEEFVAAYLVELFPPDAA